MNFFKTFLAGLLAVIVGFGLIVLIWSLVVVGMITSFTASSAPVVTNNSILRLNPGTITDSPSSSILDDFDFMSMTLSPRTTLLSAVSAIQSAATDSRIKGIYINFDEYANVSLSSLEEIRAALVEFKESGKFVVAYNENYGQIGYYVASVADKVYVNPEGGFEWTGLSLTSMFYKGLLDKLDIDPVIIRHGTFKAAVEPFMYDRMSPENRLQNQTLVNSLWAMITESVSESRDIPAELLNDWANSLAIDSPYTALMNGLVDGMRYEDQAMGELSRMVEGWSREEIAEVSEPDDDISSDAAGSPDKDPRIVSFSDYAAQLMPPGRNVSKNKIAVIYAEGSIVSGDGGMGSIGSATMAQKLARVRKDPNVKAVVLRINSPGGSSLASEVMWRELELLKQHVPVIVSMGDYAASGGYYIACPADVIFANRSTITGSIGVFGLMANVGRSLENNLGIAVDAVRTNTYSDIGSIFRDMQPAERQYVQKSVEAVYSTFVEHVAEGRNMTFEAVDKIGEGRVWAGADALSIGLIDGYGGLNDAISIAADRAGVAEDFRIWEVDDEAQGWLSLLGGVSTRIRNSVLHDQMGDVFIHYNNVKSMLDEQGVQARMPYVFDIR